MRENNGVEDNHLAGDGHVTTWGDKVKASLGGDDTLQEKLKYSYINSRHSELFSMCEKFNSVSMKEILIQNHENYPES